MEGNFQMKPTARDYILATYEESLAAKKAFIDKTSNPSLKLAS